jgi:hypothetical protein
MAKLITNLRAGGHNSLIFLSPGTFYFQVGPCLKGQRSNPAYWGIDQFGKYSVPDFKKLVSILSQGGFSIP